MNKILLTTLAASMLTVGSASALNVDIFTPGNYSETYGVGMTFGTVYNSFSSPDIQFGANTGNAWHPYGLSDFGARITGSVNAAGGTYFISLLSDDASYLFIDGVLQISRPGAHAPDYTSANISLTPGVHSIEVQFYECCGGPSALDAVLPQGVSFVNPTPDAGSTMGMLGGALGLLAAASRKFRK